jgi:hypothetical protein
MKLFALALVLAAGALAVDVYATSTVPDDDVTAVAPASSAPCAQPDTALRADEPAIAPALRPPAAAGLPFDWHDVAKFLGVLAGVFGGGHLIDQLKKRAVAIEAKVLHYAKDSAIQLVNVLKTVPLVGGKTLLIWEDEVRVRLKAVGVDFDKLEHDLVRKAYATARQYLSEFEQKHGGDIEGAIDKLKNAITEFEAAEAKWNALLHPKAAAA